QATATTTSTTTLKTTSSTTITSVSPTTITLSTTVSSQITEKVGLPEEITYAAVTIAVLAVLAVAILLTKKATVEDAN
ncbi:MAG: hypothetical protein QF381_04935, partial [Nitrososphaerales archaeon]|nr:hypothetical protein [Nitrososphaerales archaeon]